MLTNAFNLQSKTKNELKGLYVELFNKLADKNINNRERTQIQSMLYQVKLTLSVI